MPPTSILDTWNLQDLVHVLSAYRRKLILNRHWPIKQHNSPNNILQQRICPGNHSDRLDQLWQRLHYGRVHIKGMNPYIRKYSFIESIHSTASSTNACNNASKDSLNSQQSHQIVRWNYLTRMLSDPIFVYRHRRRIRGSLRLGLLRPLPLVVFDRLDEGTSRPSLVVRRRRDQTEDKASVQARAELADHKSHLQFDTPSNFPDNQSTKRTTHHENQSVQYLSGNRRTGQAVLGRFQLGFFSDHRFHHASSTGSASRVRFAFVQSPSPFLPSLRNRRTEMAVVLPSDLAGVGTEGRWAAPQSREGWRWRRRRETGFRQEEFSVERPDPVRFRGAMKPN